MNSGLGVIMIHHVESSTVPHVPLQRGVLLTGEAVREQGQHGVSLNFSTISVNLKSL